MPSDYFGIQAYVHCPMDYPRAFTCVQNIFKEKWGESKGVELVEDLLPKSKTQKRWILKIKRPDNTFVTFALPKTLLSQPHFMTSSAVCEMALESELRELVSSAAPTRMRSHRAIVAYPSYAIHVKNFEPSHVPLMQILDCWLTWRKPDWKLKWYMLNVTGELKVGCALQVWLKPGCHEIYLVTPGYETHREAKHACATLAVEKGVLHFIKHGDGQSEPQSVASVTEPKTPKELFFSLSATCADMSKQKHSTNNWYSVLKEQMDRQNDNTVTAEYYPLIAGKLHGSVLNVHAQGQVRNSKAYIVDPLFPNPDNARAAVALVALSSGVVSYLESLQPKSFEPPQDCEEPQWKDYEAPRPDLVAISTSVDTPSPAQSDIELDRRLPYNWGLRWKPIRNGRSDPTTNTSTFSIIPVKNGIKRKVGDLEDFQPNSSWLSKKQKTESSSSTAGQLNGACSPGSASTFTGNQDQKDLRILETKLEQLRQAPDRPIIVSQDSGTNSDNPLPTVVAPVLNLSPSATNTAPAPSHAQEQHTKPPKGLKSYMKSLSDYCFQNGVPHPPIHNEAIASATSGFVYRVWAVMGEEQLEHPMRFEDLHEGLERLAKSVLARMKSQAKGVTAGSFATQA